jgi:hypothetical protein
MSHGAFSDDPCLLWCTERGTPDRFMTLQHKKFTFRRGRRTWEVPVDYRTDGASIPWPLWSVVGSPFTGDYRRAALVHDKACDDAAGDDQARREADRMFYHACRAGGCSIIEATILYIGVRFGAIKNLVPAWQGSASDIQKPRAGKSDAAVRMEADFQLVANDVLSRKASDNAAAIERRTDAALSRMTGINLFGC